MDWGLGIGDWGLCKYHQIYLLFSFHPRIINIFFEKMEEEGKFSENFCKLRLDGLGIVDWGLGIGDWVNANNTEFTFFFHFIQKLLIFFWKKWKKKVNPAEVFCKYLVSTVDSGLAPLRGLIAAKDGSNWLGFKKPSIAVFGDDF